MTEEKTSQQPQVPLSGYEDNPTEVDEFLSQQFFLKLNVRELASFDDEKKRKHKKDAHALVDDLLSKEMLQMSLKDRNNIIEEIHGVQNLAPDETPEMIDSALRKMHAEILMIPSSLRRAYDRSQRLAPTGYINNAEFRLRFLRCDLFNANRAARRMVQFLDLLGEIFGDVALKRPVMLKDFSKDEINAFRTGYQQLLPYRDQSGRRVFACVGVGLKEPLLTRVSTSTLHVNGREPEIGIRKASSNTLFRSNLQSTRHAIENHETKRNGTGKNIYLFISRGIRGRGNPAKGTHHYHLAQGILGRRKQQLPAGPDHVYETSVRKPARAQLLDPLLLCERHVWFLAALSEGANVADALYFDHAPRFEPDEISYRSIRRTPLHPEGVWDSLRTHSCHRLGKRQDGVPEAVDETTAHVGCGARNRQDNR